MNSNGIVSAFVKMFASRRTLPLWLMMLAASFAALVGLSEPFEAEGNPMSEPAETQAPEETNDMVPSPATPEPGAALTPEQRQILDAYGWDGRVGGASGVWVSIKEQMFRLIENRQVIWTAPCSTAAKGPGSKLNSFKTPLGWHSIAEKIGGGAPWGQIFREKKPAKDVWRRGDATPEDLLLTRILTLNGEEPGKNKDGDVDSCLRGIYVHGTNDEEHIGQPASHGCVRLTNDDAILAYDKISIGTFLLITEE